MKTIVKRVYVLNGGQLELEASVMVQATNCGDRIKIPVQMFLLETSRGYILIDTGNDPDVITDAAKTWGVPLSTAVRPIMDESNHPYAQLKLLGLEPSDVKMVVYTHLHHDHCGGARFFPKAVHVVQKAEYRWVMYPDRFSAMPYVRTDYDHPHLDWRLAEGDWCILPGVHLIATPGHTPGHQSIALWDVPDVGSVIIAGDAVNCRDNVTQDTPGGITSDTTAAAMSMHRLTALSRAADAVVIVSHDMGFFEMLPKAPEPLARLDEEARAFCDHGIRKVYEGIADPSNLI